MLRRSCVGKSKCRKVALDISLVNHMLEFAISVFLTAPPLLVAVILHEIAHGVMAERLGDPTARSLGRITLNPLKHIDPFLTVILPGLLILMGSPIVFGGAKPVPVNFFNLRGGRVGMMWVALAGPVVNFILAIISVLAYFGVQKVLGPLPEELTYEPGVLINATIQNWLFLSVLINVVLGIFNLTPVPPLDGGRILVGILPENLARLVARLEPIGIPLVMFLLFTGVLEKVLGPVLNFLLRMLAIG